MSDDKLAERISKIGDRVSRVVSLASPSPDLMRANEGAYAALGTLLAVHSMTALHRHTEACGRHYASINGRRDCPECRVVEWTGCDKCRDEDGNPAQVCEVRFLIAQCLTRTMSTRSTRAVNRA